MLLEEGQMGLTNLTYTRRHTSPNLLDGGFATFWQNVVIRGSAFSLGRRTSIETMLFRTPSASPSFPSCGQNKMGIETIKMRFSDIY